MRVGLLPLARPTFDTGLARSKLRGMLETLDHCELETLGSRGLLLDDGAVAGEVERIEPLSPDAWIVLQTTFTDASAAAAVAERAAAPILIWAVREPRSGGRLRLNSLCGLNLASHALGLRRRTFRWIYSDPEDTAPDKIRAMLHSGAEAPETFSAAAVDDDAGREVAESLFGASIGQIGSHPPGFDTCRCDPDALRRIFGIGIQKICLDELFAAARMPDGTGRPEAEPPDLAGLEKLDQHALRLSCRLTPALKSLADARGLDALAVRCWPECFTVYGGAVCGPVSMLADEMLPCACESDVYGAVSQLIMQRVADAPVFLADLVDADFEDDTAVLWHCGQAPLSMRDPESEPLAAVHSNRGLPLLCQFPLKPGKVTIARISKARGEHMMVMASAEMLRRPLAFSGTAGVLRFERHVRETLSDIIDAGLEHHFTVAYGDFRRQLHGVAAALGLPVMEL